MEKFSVKKPFTVLVAVIMVLMLGFVSITKMKTNLLPNVSTPYLMVVTVYPGASPERVETEVSDVLQNALTVPGVSKITATSAENYSLLLMQFVDDTDMDSALVQVSNKLDQAKSDLPETALEIYHDDDSIHAINPNEITYHHLHLTHSPTVALASMEEVPSPISKLLFEEAEPRMTALREYIARQSWSTEYEVVPSNPYLLELTAKGANKGGMVRRLAQILEIRQENVYCVGDHANDIPMLTFARTAFAPANAIQAVHEVPGIHILPNCWENAIAAMIAELDKRY